MPSATTWQRRRRCDLDHTRAVPRITAQFFEICMMGLSSGVMRPGPIRNRNPSMRKLIAAAFLAAVATALVAAPSYALNCNQQGIKAQIKGVWHKFVRNNRGAYVSCGPAW
jgi:hypothetical protein